MAPEDLTSVGGAPRYRAGLHSIGQNISAWLTPNGGWGESNAALISGHKSSLLVDTLWDLPRTEAMLEAFQPQIEAAPIEQLVNTHADGDHWFGNQLVSAPKIIATKVAARHMRRYGPGQMTALRAVAGIFRGLSYVPLPRRSRWRVAADYLEDMMRPFDFSNIKPAPPTLTFSRKLALDVGGRQVILMEVGPAHTTGDLIVYLPEDRVVIAGDVLFLGSTPVLWDGSSRNWIKACEKILALHADTIVPGHGPLTDPSGVEAVRRYWQFLRSAVRVHFDKSRPPAEAALRIARSDEFLKQPFATWDGKERILINVYAIYRKLLGRKRHVNPLTRVNLLRKTAILKAQLEEPEDDD